MSIDGIDPIYDGGYDAVADSMGSSLADPAFAGNAYAADGTPSDSISALQELSGLAEWGADGVMGSYPAGQEGNGNALVDSESALPESVSPLREVFDLANLGADKAVESYHFEQGGNTPVDVTESAASSQDQGNVPTEGHAGHDQTPFCSAQCTKSECNQNISNYQSKVDHWKAEVASAERRLQKALANGDIGAASSAKNALVSAKSNLADAKNSLAYWKGELSTAKK